MCCNCYILSTCYGLTSTCYNRLLPDIPRLECIGYFSMRPRGRVSIRVKVKRGTIKNFPRGDPLRLNTE